jgi:integrase
MVRFLTTKTATPRAMPLMGEARTLLEDLARHRHPSVPWVFPSWQGQEPIKIESAWETARKYAGVENFHFHDLRHTFASYMAMSGATLREIAEVLGHVNMQMTLRYSHMLPGHTKGVVERMTQQFLITPPEEDPTHE